MPQETRDKIRKALLGKPLSKTHRAAMSRAAKKRWSKQSEKNAQRMRQYERQYARYDPENVQNRWEADERYNADRLAAVAARKAADVLAILDEVDRSGLGRLGGLPTDASPDEIIALARIMAEVVYSESKPQKPHPKGVWAPEVPAVNPIADPSAATTEPSATVWVRILRRLGPTTTIPTGGERNTLAYGLLKDETLSAEDRASINEVLLRV